MGTTIRFEECGRTVTVKRYTSHDFYRRSAWVLRFRKRLYGAVKLWLA